MLSHIPPRVKGLVIVSLIMFGAIAYIHPYVLTLEYLDSRSSLPFIEVAQFLNLAGGRAGVFTAHPDLLAKYYKGSIYKLPEKGGFEYILQEAEEKGVRYLVIDSTCINSKDLIDLYYHSVNPNWGRIPSEFQLVKAKKWLYGIYLIGPEENHQVWFKAAIFSHLQWGTNVIWETMLTLLGASTSTFDDTTIISSVNISEFDVVVFDDFKRSIDDAERLHLEQSIEKGTIVIVSGLSPFYLAGGTTNLTRISSWFGATVFSEAPKEARWKVKFTENAKEIMKDLDLNQEYALYTDSDWSTPTGCLAQPEAVIYAYRVDDPSRVAAIFSHKFGKGTIIFNGPRHGFRSPDAGTFVAFLRTLILSALA